MFGLARAVHQPPWILVILFLLDRVLVGAMAQPPQAPATSTATEIETALLFPADNLAWMAAVMALPEPPNQAAPPNDPAAAATPPAQPTPTPSEERPGNDPEKVLANIPTKLEAIKANQDLSEELRDKILKVYQAALKQWENGKQWQQQRLAMLEKLKRPTAPETNAAPTSPTVLEVSPEQIPPTEIPQALAQLDRQINANALQLNELDAALKKQLARQEELPQLIAAVQGQLEQLRKPNGVGPTENPELATAQAALNAASQFAAEQELRFYQEELDNFEARVARDRQLREQLSQAAQALAERKRSLDERLFKLRKAEAQAAVERAAQQADQWTTSVQRSPELQKLLQNNQERAAQRQRLIEANQVLARHIQDLSTAFDVLRKRAVNLEEKVTRLGAVTSVSEMLRRERIVLPKLIAAQEQLIAENQKELVQTIDERFRWEEELRTLSLPNNERLQMYFPKLHLDVQQTPELSKQIQTALDFRKELIQSLIGSYDTKYKQLVDLKNWRLQLLEQALTYQKFVTENIFWMRSTQPLSLTSLRVAFTASQWFLQPVEWQRLLHGLYEEFTTTGAVVNWLILLCLLALLLLRTTLREQLRQLGAAVNQRYTQTVLLTLYALLLTLLIAAIVPLFLYFVSWQLRMMPGKTTFSDSLGMGLQTASWAFFIFDFIRQSCRSSGLGEIHFRWSKTTLAYIRRHLYWLMPTMLPMIFLYISLEKNLDLQLQARPSLPAIDFTVNGLTATPAETHYNDSLGRLAFITAEVLLSIFWLRLFRPSTGIIQDFLGTHSGTWIFRLRFVMYLIVALPIAFAIASALGYHYTARQLNIRLTNSLAVFIAIIWSYALIMRWMFALRGQLALRQARERRAAEASTAPDAAQIPLDQNWSDLARINAQTRQLINICLAFAVCTNLWYQFEDLIPAFNFLDRGALWSTTSVVTREIRTPEGTVEYLSETVPRNITYWDILLSIFIGTLAVVGAKNLPGLLEVTVLQRLPMDNGARYATNTLLRYSISIVGTLVVCQQLGLSWDKVQWLVAAVSVGLGFGLQEVFANFVCGLILLFERPIRVGDTVSVGDVSGTITRIRIRSTTIMDWNRKELIVPNKALITDKVINWTLSDRSLRLVVPVGVAYGSDLQKVQQIMLKAAYDNPAILADPAPTALFEDFSDSSLKFVLRCFVSSIDDMLTARHDLLAVIDREFRAAKIEIAFPQQDLHIRSATGLQTLPFLSPTNTTPKSTPNNGTSADHQPAPNSGTSHNIPNR